MLTLILAGLVGVALGLAGAYLGLAYYFAKNRH